MRSNTYEVDGQLEPQINRKLGLNQLAGYVAAELQDSNAFPP